MRVFGKLASCWPTSEWVNQSQMLFQSLLFLRISSAFIRQTRQSLADKRVRLPGATVLSFCGFSAFIRQTCQSLDDKRASLPSSFHSHAEGKFASCWLTSEWVYQSQLLFFPGDIQRRHARQLPAYRLFEFWARCVVGYAFSIDRLDTHGCNKLTLSTKRNIDPWEFDEQFAKYHLIPESAGSLQYIHTKL